MTEPSLELWIRSLLTGPDPLSVDLDPPVVARDRPAWPQPSIEPYAAGVDSLAQTLGEMRPFSELSGHVREAVAAKLTLHPFQEGDVLLRQGDVADSMLIVLDGAVQVIVEEAGRMHTIARLGPHTVLGEIGLVTNELRSAHVVAAAAGCAALIARDDFEHIAGRYPRLSIALSELIAERVGTLTIDVLCGKTIEGYTIRRRLGRGAMGIVYAAVEGERESPVALKMLRHDLTFDRLATERFHQEAEIVKDLRHPNIIRVFREFSAFGTSFIAMELCEGPSLRELAAREGELELETVRHILGQLAAGLAHAHRSGVAHRDLKPSNVLFAANGIAKLADFGLARRLAPDQAGLTVFNQLLGTPHYMAPEQLEGDRGDAKSDIFSLGCIAYELLASQPLFQAEKFPDLLKERRRWTLPSRDAIRRDLDDPLYSLLSRCLAEEPGDRNISLDEVAEWAGPVPGAAP